jgi:hypothetical protein
MRTPISRAVATTALASALALPGIAAAAPTHLSARAASPAASKELAVSRAKLAGDRLAVDLSCATHMRGRAVAFEGRMASPHARGSAAFACRHGRASVRLQLSRRLSAIAAGGRQPLGLRVQVAGRRKPVLLPVSVGRPRTVGARASDYSFVTGPGAMCISGALYYDPGSLTVSMRNWQGFGAPTGSTIYWRSWLFASGRWYASQQGFWSYRYFPSDGGSYTSGDTFYSGGDNAPGEWMNPQTWIVQRLWVRPAVEIHVPATNSVYFDYVWVLDSTGVKRSSPNWCGFGV